MNQHRYHTANGINRIVHLFFTEIEFDVRYGVMKRAKLASIQGDQLREFAFTEADWEWLSRSIQTAIANIKSRVSWALRQHSCIGNNKIVSQPQEYVLSFEFPKDDWLGDIQTLTDFIHNYISQFSIAGFLKMAGLESYALAEAEATESLQRVVNEVNKVTLSNPPIFRL